jgi:excisionase family DNA binding protein
MSLKSQARSHRPGGGRSAPNACPDRLLDVAQAAAILGLKSPRTLYKWAYAGRIPSVRIGRLLRFRHADLAHLIVQGERPAFAAPDVFPPPAALPRR